ncbi:MAG TPA: hypothetical protein VKI44_22545 [Acetobacteraceae bacterium]|nr:hypothetical protein [Acetobacteraceae bacterium]
MFPIAIIAGVIGAVVSGVQGASWVSDHLDSSKAAASAGGKAEAKPQADAKAPSFDAALAAQVTGQSVPASTPVTSTQSSVPVSQLGTDYDTLARTKAGILAYSHVGEHRNSQAKQSTGTSDDSPVTRS